jgi:hypothetical protein
MRCNSACVRPDAVMSGSAGTVGFDEANETQSLRRNPQESTGISEVSP